MTRRQKTFWTIIGLSVLLILLSVTSTMDYTEEVIYNMPNATYRTIQKKLGPDASDYDIAREYMRNRDLYK